MCIILFGYRTHPNYNLILAANRDEYYGRSTARASVWEDAPNILAGRDLERGGTWLGVTIDGRFAAVTNYRDPASVKKNALSRGHLVSDFLRSSEPPLDYLTRTASHSADYNGYNLIVGDSDGVYYHSNKASDVRSLSPGIYGLSNDLLDTPWPKVEKGKLALSQLVTLNGEFNSEDLFKILADQSRAEDNVLPNTGISLEYERALSPILISTPEYGTRSSSLLMIDAEDNIKFIERTFEKDKPQSDSVFEF